MIFKIFTSISFPFFLTIYSVIVFPAFYIFLSNHYSNLYFTLPPIDYLYYSYINFINSLIFVFAHITVLYIKSIIPKLKNYNPYYKKKFNYNIFFYICFYLILIFFLVYGIPFLSLIGSSVTSMDFRKIGFIDIPTFVMFFIELSRKIIFPFFFGYYFYLNDRQKYLFALLGLLLAGLITLDRYPILSLFLLLFMIWIYQSRSKVNTFFKIFVSFVCLLMVGSLTTYLQYNQLDFDLTLIVLSAFDFLFHRILLVPSYAAIEIGIYYTDIYDFFLLKFSRLNFLWGGDYVDFGISDSYTVAPVGFLADIYRNFGFIIVYIICFFVISLAYYFSSYKYLNLQMKIVLSFLLLNLSLYLVFGTFFSLGVFSYLIFIFLVRRFRLL